MELRNGTREIVREIERISCNPALFIREWKEQPVLTSAGRMVSGSCFLLREGIVTRRGEHQFQNGEGQLPPLNWTLGYTKFRRLVGKLDDLINDAKEVALLEQPSFWEHLESLAPEVRSIFNERWPDVRNDARWGRG